VTGRSPFFLDGAENLWVVLDGQIDVFFTPRQGAAQTGPRDALFTAVAGDILFGVDPAVVFDPFAQGSGGANGLIAGGIPGTRALRCARSEYLARACADEASLAAAAARIDRFLELIGRGVVKDIIPAPRIQRRLSTRDDGSDIAPDQPVSSGDERLLWAELRAPDAGAAPVNALFVGSEPPPEGAFFPVPQNCWFVAQEPCRVALKTTVDMIASGAFEAALDAWCAMVASLLSMNARLRAADDLGALRSAQTADRESFARAFGELSSALPVTPRSAGGDEETAGASSRPDRSARLRAAFDMVLERQGVTLPAVRDDDQAESFQDLAEGCDLRIREVRLSGRWWLEDGAPLAAWLEESGAASGRTKRIPVALLPPRPGTFLRSVRTGASLLRGTRRPDGYRIWDAETGERPVDEDIASRLDGTAWQLYASLPPEPLSLSRLFATRNGRDGTEEGAIRSLLFRGEGLFVTLLELLMASLALVPPAIIGVVASDVIPRGNRERLLLFILLLAAVGVSTGLLRLARELSLARLETRLSHRVMAGIWDRILRLPVAFFSRFQAGDLVNRGIGLFLVRRSAVGAIRLLRINGFFVLFSLAQCFWFDRLSALAGAGCMLVLTAVGLRTGRRQIDGTRRMTDIQNRTSGLTFQILSGIAKLRTTGSENRAFGRWATLFSRQRALATDVRRDLDRLSQGMTVFPFVATLVILAGMAGRYVAGAGAWDAGNLLAFLSAWATLQTSFLACLSSAALLAGTLPGIENLHPILDAHPESGRGKTDPGRITGRIDIENVTFSYPAARIDENRPRTPHGDAAGRPILRDFSLHIRPGEFVAVVGPSGSGKSTLLRLLLGFETPDMGSIFYDSKDLNDLDKKKLRSSLGVVLQDGGLLSGDIATNVRCSRAFSLDQVREALEIAGLTEEIDIMPMGLHTIVSEGAGTLSGGQKQRLLIARAVAGRPRVLMFDEATSALDNRTQAKISRSLERIDATRIVVAHRLSTIAHADRIVVMDRGTIAEEGTFDELMSRDGLFRTLARRQMLVPA
jgi:NHLM bacteriocin system ABC transporter ATP-binding protein